MVDTSVTKEEAIEENAFETCTHLKQLCDNSIKVKVSMSKSFSNFNFLTVINLSYTNLEDEGTITLVNALKNSAPSLGVIEMAGNNIRHDAASTIAACLVRKRHLKKLNFSENDLKDEGCVEIVKCVENLELEYVDMSYNDLRKEGALGLANVVVKKECFKMLNIDGNVISVKGIEEVKEIFKNCPKLLGPLDENDPDGGVNEDDEEKNLEVFEDEFVSVFFFY